MGWWAVAAWGAFELGKRIFGPKPYKDAEVTTLGDIHFPTSGESRPVPVLYGTACLKAPNVLWYGDLNVVGLEPGKRRHYLGVQWGLCAAPAAGVDDLIGIIIDGRIQLTAYSITEYGAYRISKFNHPDLFDPTIDTERNGIVGEIYFYYGRSDQEPNPYLESKAVSTPTSGGFYAPHGVSAYRGLCYAVAHAADGGDGETTGMLFGHSPTIAPWWFIIQSCPNGLGLADDKHLIDCKQKNPNGTLSTVPGKDANPACVIYDVMTRPRYRGGMGWSSAEIDIDALRAMGENLYTEGLGISAIQDGLIEGGDFIREICRTIDATPPDVDPETGLITMKLIRADYNVEDLVVLDESNVESIDIDEPDWGDTKNPIRVKFTAREWFTWVEPGTFFNDASEQYLDQANVTIRAGATNPEEIPFRLLTSRINANKIASRVGKAAGYPFKTMELHGVKRLGARLRTGDVALLNWPPEGIVGMPIRINGGDRGDLLDERSELRASQDIFGLGWTAYSTPPITGWVDPTSGLLAVPDAVGIEAPYELVKTLNPAAAAYALIVAQRPSGYVLGCKAFQRLSAGSYDTGVFKTLAAFSVKGTLSSSVSKTASSITVTIAKDADLLASITSEEFASGKNLMLITDGFGTAEEFVAWKTIIDNGDGTYTFSNLARGCLDTTREAHSSGGEVWFVTIGMAIVDQPVSSGASQEVYEKFVSFNSLGGFDFSTSPERRIAGSTPWRALLPLLPTDFKFNSSAYPASFTGDLVITWKNRNRLGSWSYANSGATSTLETDASISIRIYNEDETDWVDYTGLTGETKTFTEADEIAEFGSAQSQLRVVITSVRGSDTSRATLDHTMTRV